MPKYPSKPKVRANFTLTYLMVGAIVMPVFTLFLARPELGMMDQAAQNPDLAGFEAAAGYVDEALIETTPAPVTSEQIDALPDAPLLSELLAMPRRPSFDLVRVQPNGAGLIAGIAEPGSRVTVYADEMELGDSVAAADGSFVVLFNADESDAPRALRIDALSIQGIRAISSERVVLLPPAMPEESDVSAATQVQKPVVGATIVVRDDDVQVMANVDDIPMGAPLPVRLLSISYGVEGHVIMEGTGTPGAEVIAYLDDASKARARVGRSGGWMMTVPSLEQGLYTLRVDQLSRAGEVISRVETPFQRDVPQPDAAPADGVSQRGSSQDAAFSLTVQPGGTLWTIARDVYGSGVEYTQIFLANETLIKDPNLIYPGQVLAIPDAKQPG